jgi:CBS domain containing-hemolysin-like protein
MVTNTIVREFMTPVEDFPRVSQDATFREAVAALEKAREEFSAGRAKQFTLLVEGEKGQIIGKVSPMDVLRCLEPGYVNVIDSSGLRFKDVNYVVESMREKMNLWAKPFDDLCHTASNRKVRDFMRRPAQSTQVKASDSMDTAFHHFLADRHDSLFVTDGDTVVGILKFSDVYSAVSKQIMDVCVMSPE